jgi:hypothetical protein
VKARCSKILIVAVPQKESLLERLQHLLDALGANQPPAEEVASSLGPSQDFLAPGCALFQAAEAE